MNSADRPRMPGVHRVEKVEGLAAATLADHNAVRGHPQRFVDQHLDGYGSAALGVGQATLQRDAVRELTPKMQLGLVFNRDDALVLSDEPGEHTHERRLACACSARYEDVEPRGDGSLEKRDELSW